MTEIVDLKWNNECIDKHLIDTHNMQIELAFKMGNDHAAQERDRKDVLRVEYRHHKIADQAKLMMRDVEMLANIIHQMMGLAPSNYQSHDDIRERLNRVQYLRFVTYFERDRNYEPGDPRAPVRYIIDMPIVRSPIEEDEKDRQITYLRELLEKRNDWRIGRFSYPMSPNMLK